MTINSSWLEKDFKQKYFLYCKDCEFKLRKTEDKIPHKNRIKIKDYEKR